MNPSDAGKTNTATADAELSPSHIGLTNSLNSADSILLQNKSEQYDIWFLYMALRTPFLVANSNVVKNDGREDIIKINELPKTETNTVFALYPPGEKINFIYEITTNQ